MSQSPKRKQKRQQRTMVRVRVPATSANMGPGFDCIGIAVNIWNELKVEVVNNEKAVRFFFFAFFLRRSILRNTFEIYYSLNSQSRSRARDPR